ncbi:MAG: Asp-tRNA(Asn)/Glu-tRNA(Gln) amidotransferase subunit GatC [Elusimicrobiota bacterium]|nr:Asp-tRNA(Asn)/Glu-tRNA(Gln) amidotransferase subunit GatC [Elusimicrobiota bacterium]
MSVSLDEVKKIAKLARLRLTEAEAELYGGQLTKIVDSMSELAAVDTSEVAPTTSVLGAVNVMRDDSLMPFEDTEAFLANAPERDGPYFKVKRVIE